MKVITLAFMFLVGQLAVAQVYRFGEPKGVTLWSNEKHNPGPDGYSGVKPVVIVEDKEMTIVWGDSKAAGSTDKSWKAIIVHRDKYSISAISLDTGDGGSSVMLYTIDLERGFLYMSAHKNSKILNASAANSYVAKIEKK